MFIQGANLKYYKSDTKDAAQHVLSLKYACCVLHRNITIWENTCIFFQLISSKKENCFKKHLK